MGGTPSDRPVNDEELKALPPEFRAILLRVIDHYESRLAEQDRRIAELEEQLGQSPRNSSLPPSSEHPHARPDAAKKPGKSKRKRGGQPGRKKHSRELLPVGEVDELIPCVPATCGHLRPVRRETHRPRSRSDPPSGLGTAGDQAARHGVSAAPTDMRVLRSIDLR